jgi:CRP-like cAMP-binding protein
MFGGNERCLRALPPAALISGKPCHMMIGVSTNELARHRHTLPRTTELVVEQHFNVDAFLAKVGEGRSIHRFKKDEVIFAQGDPADAVFYIQSGKVKVTVVSEQGKEAVLALSGPDDFVGESCVVGQARRLATASAMMATVLMRLDKAAVVRVIREEAEFSEMFIAHLLTRTMRLEADLVDQLFNSSEKRLARVLLLLANFANDDEEPKHNIDYISQETLAQMIGTTRARVSSFMNKFRKLGFIDYNGGIMINKSLLNVVLLDPIEGDD